MPQLPEDAVRLLAQYLALVDDYRKLLNLTAFAAADELVEELVVESARLLEFGELAPGLRCIDLGSGVGSPVVTLAVLCPQAQFVAVESRERRAAFLRQVAASLRLTNLDVRCVRAEQVLKEEPASFGLVCARAFAQPALLMKFAAGLLSPDGELRSYFGAHMEDVASASIAEGLELRRTLSYEHGGALRHIYSARRAI